MYRDDLYLYGIIALCSILAGIVGVFVGDLLGKAIVTLVR